jgi:hypothetical protein
MKNFYKTIMNLIVLLFVVIGLVTAQTFPDKQQIQTNQKAKEFFEQQMNSNNLPLESTSSLGMQQREFVGRAAYDYFGYSIASAGDINGDGFDDIIMGAYNHNVDGFNAVGQVYIYLGDAAMDYTPDYILNGEAANDQFGRWLSSAGDVNGDGYDDVIIGAHRNQDGGFNAGKAYIYFGGPNMDNAADLTITGGAAGDYLGSAVSKAGDVNGDGYDDVIIGAWGRDGGATDRGRAYICFGGNPMDGIVDVWMTGENSYDYFGHDVADAGDVNGDGYDDIIIGAYGNDDGGGEAGKSYIFYGGSNMDFTADVTMIGEAADDYFGFDVSAAGDVNGDGYSDVLIGASQNDDYASDAGKVYLYYGGSTMDDIADIVIHGEAAGDEFGSAIAAAGDLNGDGYGDILIGANNYDVNLNGKVYVYFGGAFMDTMADFTMVGEASGDRLGQVVAAAGDVNQDGYPDMLFAAPFNNEGGTWAGKVYLLMRTLSGYTNYADVTMTGEATFDNFGYSVSNAGDVNGDGYDDVIVGAHHNDNGGTSAGEAYIYYGGAAMDNTVDITMTGEASEDYFGGSVSGAGDVNGDGYDDVIIGAYRHDGVGSDAGRAYIYFGGATMDNIADVTMNGQSGTDGFGSSVSAAGDVNGDGYDDVIVGAREMGGSTGGAYVFYGSATMDNTADVTMIGEAAADFFGNSVSNAGDINGDGYSDVIVGAQQNDDGGNNAGKIYIYYGGITMNNTADVTMTGEAADDYFGKSVSGAGDVNSDGYDDVIIGATGNDDSGSGAGKTYIYYGSDAMDNTADVTMSGQSLDNAFGISVSAARDVNGDGFADVIVGAYNNDDGGNNAGKAYIYYGGTAMDNTVDMSMIGEGSTNNFGGSVSTAGDVNGDGYEDVIIGAYNNSDGGTFAGKSYIYFSSALSIKPNIFSAADVPHDQGGYVKIKWSRCAYDNPNDQRVNKYIVYGSGPRVNGHYSWEEIAELNAAYKTYYSYTANTNYDSTSQSSALFYYSISAFSTSNGEIWTSNVKSAYSVDNISPSGTSQILARQIGNHSVITEWERNTIDADFHHYAVHRSDVDGFQPTGSTLLATTTDTFYVDTNPVDLQNTYYRVISYDIHENPSPPSVQANIIFDSSLPVFMSSFSANMLSNGLVQINFTTASEIELIGFNIWRSKQSNGDYSKIASYLDHKELRSKGSSATGGEYSRNDATVESNQIYYYKLEAVDINGSSEFIGPISIKVNYVPVEFVLHQNFPNPFNPETYIPYELPVTSDVELIIYNSIGQKIKSYRYIDKPAGIYKQRFISQNLSSGMYFYIINATGKDTEKERTYNKVMKMLLIK